jgi:hypothetical protein
MLYQVETSDKCQFRDKKNHQYFSIVSLPTDSVIVDHAVFVTLNVATFKTWPPRSKETKSL